MGAGNEGETATQVAEITSRVLAPQRCWNSQARTPALRALAAHFVKKNRCGRSDIERIHFWWHRDGNGFVAGGEDGFGYAVALAAEDDAAIAAEVGLRENFLIGVWVSRNAADAVRAKFFQAVDEGEVGEVRFVGELVAVAEFGELNDGQLQERAHGIADGSAQEGTAGGFADDECLDAEGNAVADERTEVFGVGESVNGDEEVWAWSIGEDVFN